MKFCTDGSYAENGGKGPLVGVIMDYKELLIMLCRSKWTRISIAPTALWFVIGCRDWKRQVQKWVQYMTVAIYLKRYKYVQCALPHEI